MNIFKNILLGLVARFITPEGAAKLMRQALGTKKGTAAVAQAAPVIAVIAQAAGNAAAIRIDHAAGTGGDVQKVLDLVRAAREAGLIK